MVSVERHQQAFFEALLAAFARETGAGRTRRIVLVLDNAGWHGEAGLSVPDGIRLVYLPPSTPELQPPRGYGRWSTNRSSTITSSQSLSPRTDQPNPVLPRCFRLHVS